MGKTAHDDLNAITAVEREVDELRERTQSLLGELERRIRDGVERAKGTVERVRHAVDLPAHVKALPQTMKRHPKTSAGVGLGVALSAGLLLWWQMRRRREARRPLNRLRRNLLAYRTLVLEPDRLLRR